MPVEFFHSLLATVCGADKGSLWMILEEDPAAFLHYDAEGHPELPRSGGFRSVEISPGAFVEHHLKSLALSNRVPNARPAPGSRSAGGLLSGRIPHTLAEE
jgi:hypothetical protein